ncbi:MAG: LCP family protein [Anaerolineae bacterium]
MPDRHRQRPKTRTTSARGALWTAFMVVFVVGGLFFGYLFYASVRDIVAYAELPFAIGPSGGGHVGGSNGERPVQHRELTQRVNILFLGVDRRDNDPGPWRTDTMILFSVDPISKTASMLSIPRDLWVAMPGLDRDDRINSAHVWGDEYNLPGGGLGYAKKTVQYNLGIPVHYAVRLDFNGFVKIIDAIGGIDVEVPREIIDNEYPTPDYGTMRLVIKPGLQHMDGDLALKYARTRHQYGDIDRARRQQQVILAVRAKIMSLNFPIARIPEQLRILGDSVLTDMDLEAMYAVAQAARQVPSENIRSGVIDETMVISWKTPSGAEVLVPKREQIRVLVSELFPPSAPQVSLGPLGDRDKLAKEAARIEIQNGTETAGLASRASTELRSLGYNVVRYGNADRFDYANTMIIYYSDKQYTLESLKAQLKVDDDMVMREDSPKGDVDIRVILGADTN